MSALRVTPEILAGLFARTAQIAMLLGAAVLVVLRLPPAEQGYFWTIAGLGALVQVGELGLTQVVLQTAAHLRAAGDEDGLRRFWRSAKRVAAWIAPAAALVTLAAGFALFGAAGSDAAAWRGPWLVFVAALAAVQALSPGIGYVEGAVSAADAWRFHARLELAAGIVLLAALVLGAGLWSLPLQAATRLAGVAFWLSRRRSQFPLPAGDGFGAPRWRAEVWPFQWKIAVSAATGFLIFRAFTPIVFASMGAEAAARFGLSLAVMGSWLAVTVAWPSSQIARVGRLASRGEEDELRGTFRRMFVGSTAFAAAGAALILASLWLLERAGLPFSARSAGLAATGMLLAAGVLQHAVLCASVRLRAERRDPLLPYSVAGSLINAGALWTAAGTGNLSHVALAYLLCSCLGVAMGVHAFVANVPSWRAYLRAA